jgi:hypothetical protein
MSLLHEIRSQSRPVRMALWGLSVFTTLSIAGFLWFTSVERQMFMALHTDPEEQQTFLARQEERAPKPLAAMSKALGSLSARIGDFVGFSREEGFDRPDQQDKVYLLPLSQ